MFSPPLEVGSGFGGSSGHLCGNPASKWDAALAGRQPMCSQDRPKRSSRSLRTPSNPRKTNKNQRNSIHLTRHHISDQSHQRVPKVTPKPPQGPPKWTEKNTKMLKDELQSFKKSVLGFHVTQKVSKMIPRHLK